MDSSILAIGATNINSKSGYVQVYRVSQGKWTQIGNNLQGGGLGGGDKIFGYISLSADGKIIAVGDSDSSTQNGMHSGAIKVYQNISGAWTQIGQDISGKTYNSKSGYNVSLSANGNIVAFSGYIQNNSLDNYVSVYYRNSLGIWIQLGSDFYIQNAPIWYGGHHEVSIALSSTEMGINLAIGYPNCSNKNQVINTSRGVVRVYEYNYFSNWTQIGQDITEPHQFGYFGSGVSLSYDGKKIAISAPNAMLNGQPNDGFTQVYENDSGNWKKIINSITYPGNERFRSAIISGNGNFLAVSLYDYFMTPGNYITNDYVHVYDLTKAAASNQFVLENFNVFPNPATDILNITLENELILQKVIIFNNLGQIVKETEHVTIDVSNLAKGIYHVEVQTNQGKAVKKAVLK